MATPKKRPQNAVAVVEEWEESGDDPEWRSFLLGDNVLPPAVVKDALRNAAKKAAQRRLSAIAEPEQAPPPSAADDTEAAAVHASGPRKRSRR